MTLVGLAPMDGVTSEPFRLSQSQICKPDIIFTEFVSAEGITKGGVKLFDELMYSQSERPIVGQIFGKDPDSFYKAAVILSHLGFDQIDINMGCPAKTVTNHGSGAALITNPLLASRLITAVQSGISDYKLGVCDGYDVSFNQKTQEALRRNLEYSDFNPQKDHRPTIPISVKTRIGIDKPVLQGWIESLLKHNLDVISVHGRTLKQLYSGKSDWEQIKLAVNLATGTKTKIWGSGDIYSRTQALNYANKYGVSGVLIGRAAMDNPWSFESREGSPEERFQAMLVQSKNFTKIFPNRRFDPLRKIFLAYTSGLSNAKQLRSKLVSVKSISELLALELLFQ